MKFTPYLLQVSVSLLLLSGCGAGDVNLYDLPKGTGHLMDIVGVIPQVYEVDPAEPNTLIAGRGTIIEIPENAFKNAGEGPVTIDIIEALEIRDIIGLNAQTISDGKLLSTDGVVYINARQGDKTLEVADGKFLQVKLPVNSVNKNMQAFVGEFDENGSMNWTAANSLTVDTTAVNNELVLHGMIEIPFEYYPYKEEYYWKDSVAKEYPFKDGVLRAPSSELLVSEEEAEYCREMIDIIESEKFAGTYIATREFAERMYRLVFVGHQYFYEPTAETEGWVEFGMNEFAPIQLEVLQTYINNVDKPLWYADSLVFRLVNDYEPPNPDASNYDSYVENCNYQKEFFKNFVDERMTGVIVLDDRGVDLETSNALDQLMARGLSPEEASFTMRLYTLQQEAIAGLKQDKDAFIRMLEGRNQGIEQLRAAAELNYYVIEANQLGWMNVDIFLEMEESEPASIVLNVDEAEAAGALSVSLVIPELDCFLTAYKGQDGNYRFTQDKTGYTNLPIGYEAFVIAVGKGDEESLFAKKSIEIKAEMEVNLYLRERSERRIREALDFAGNREASSVTL